MMNEAQLVVIRPWYVGRVVHWRWVDCNGAGVTRSPEFSDRKGGHYYVGLGDPPTVCVAAPDFTCPVHTRGPAIAMGPAA